MTTTRMDIEYDRLLEQEIVRGDVIWCEGCRSYARWTHIERCGLCGAEFCRDNCMTQDITPGVDRWLCKADSYIEIEEVNELLVVARDQRLATFYAGGC